MSVYIGGMVLGSAFLASTAVAQQYRQPDYVTQPLLVCGIVLVTVFAAAFGLALYFYGDLAERRKIAAKDL